ncbi:MAG: primosomal protein N' [Deltaproteobacteria bacterium]
MYVQVALNIPAGKLFTYAVPDNLQSKVQIGKRVFVPFGSRKRTGFIVGAAASSTLEDVRPIGEILDEEPLFGDEDLKFYSWIADYFLYPLGKTLAELIPSGTEKKDLLWIFPAPVPSDVCLSPSQEKLLDFLNQSPRGIALGHLIKNTELKNAANVVKSLHLAGLVRITEKQKQPLAVRTQKIIRLAAAVPDELKLTSRQEAVVELLKKAGPTGWNDLLSRAHASGAVVKKLLEKGVITASNAEVIRKASLASSVGRNREEIILNDEQQKALLEIDRLLCAGAFRPVLFHGVTGSGKTEVYLNAIEHVLANGGTAMYLVPEIALTPQLISRIAGRFDEDKIAVIHSGIAQSIRYDQWRQIKRSRINLVIGARSALFAPLTNLKLIIVDEEHDASYKQDDRLCYHARDLAVVKAKFTNAVVVLGSATPGIRSYYNARTKKYHYLELTQRVNHKPLPRIDIIDMKAEKEAHGKTPILSDALISAIAETLGRKEQTLLFLNKRGFDTFLVCGDCGYHFRCPNCAVALKSHLAENIIKCHYCDYSQKAMPLCPECRGGRILNYGTGTQKLEKEIECRFPGARICRMDSDTTARKGTQEKILAALEKREIDILLGTQMITKGHDFPAITLVGVISADTSLNMPDFRAAEKTFQMLTQVAGRGGRGDVAGRVIIQTFNPDHYALRYTQQHDYKSFYADEMEFRKALQYPPYSYIINLRLSSARKEALLETVQDAGRQARKLAAPYGNAVEIIGPSESPLARIRGEHRQQMLIKGRDSKTLHAIAAALLEKHDTGAVKMTIDVDPENFM